MFKGLKAIVAGLIAGTAIGILFSPKKGHEIRKNFKNEIDEGGTGFQTAKNTFVDVSKNVGEVCKEAYGDFSKSETGKNLKKKIDDNISPETKSKAKNLAKKAKATAKKAKSTAKKAKSTAKKRLPRKK